MDQQLDPRETPFNGRVAHVSLKGKVAAELFTEGELRHVFHKPVDIRDAPLGNRLRQLNVGEAFCVLEEAENHAFGIRMLDGYVGWASTAFLSRKDVAYTHQILTQRAAFLSSADVKVTKPQNEHLLPFGALVEELRHPNPTHQEKAKSAGWLVCKDHHGKLVKEARYVRLSNIAPIGQLMEDPAAAAQLFLHTPYLWGGNSAFGIDCSGLVQAALLACGLPCPGDSDQQETRAGETIPVDAPLQRNDLIFWKGHVAMMLDPDTIIHANAHHMAVAIEPLAVASARIEASGGGQVTLRRRPDLTNT